ncbi:MAG: hypothetical protein Kow0068_12500 [Marinilabiliales bacterium]
MFKQVTITGLLCIIFIVSLTGQNYDYSWIKQFGSYSDESGYNINVDDEQNIYLTGTFSYTADFIDTVLVSYGSNDGFLAKFDSVGNLIWIVQFGGDNSDEGTLIDFDSNDNVILGGMFHSDTAYIGDTALFSCGCSDFTFIAKYSKNGDFIWANEIIGDGSVQIKGLAVVPGDSVIATGFYFHSAYFENDTIYPNGLSDIFIVKYGPDGNEKWHRQFGGTNLDMAYDLVANGNNIYITGSFKNKVTFGTDMVISRGASDVFLLKTNQFGDPLWAVSFGSAGSDEALAMTLDADNNLIITGYGGDSLYFGGNYISSAGGSNFILSKFDSSGNPLWCKMAGGIFDDMGLDVSCNQDNRIFVTGKFMDTLNIDTNQLVTNYYSDIFFAEFYPDGNSRWVKQIHSEKNDEGTAILYANNSIYLTGHFRDTALFDTNEYYSYGGSDIFFARLLNGLFVNYSEPFNTNMFVYPNPAKYIINISGFENCYFVQLYNSSAIMLLQSDKENIYIEDLPSGLYFLRILSENKVVKTGKIIKL